VTLPPHPEQLILPQARGTKPALGVEALPEAATICTCQNVAKGTICRAICDQQLASVGAVKAATRAGTGCGSCTPLLGELLSREMKRAGKALANHLCEHFPKSRQELYHLVRVHGIRTFDELIGKHGRGSGCEICKPAVASILASTWNEHVLGDEHVGLQDTNDRFLANIQRDGTYSVVPRIWGGVTSAKELRAIADVAEKYAVPTVKVTGGQRIDLLGVKKEDLPKMWKDLSDAGFVSGHAYGKALRTVKTCVGKEWCRFGTQDSTGLGIKLERTTWGSWHPHKVKLAVSGCPRNCAEATIKDLGVVCVESGYELHVGGNGGIKVRATDFLCKVGTEEDVIEHACAYLQLYREEARYLERTAPWIERVGLSHVRERIVDDADGRRALCARFLEAQKYSQVDPWAERANGKDASEFASLDAGLAALSAPSDDAHASSARHAARAEPAE
jgi:nitrite reductase (NADH) large subunit